MALSNKLRSLLLGKVWPEPSATAAGRRTADVLQSLHRAGHELHFATASAQPEQALDLAAMGVRTHSVQVNDSAFDQWLEALEPDVVIFDRFMTEEQFGWRVEQACPSALRVLDTSDLHCLRKAREEVVLKGAEYDLYNDVALREIASIHRCDLSLIISEFEWHLLQDIFGLPESQIAYWPFYLANVESGPSYEQRQHCILIGSFLHAPNLDAARWCAQEIWPRVRARAPELELHLYGSYGEKYASEFHRTQHGIHFKGRAVDALHTMQQYRLNLAPLRFGAGLKGKLFDGFQAGTPGIVTPIAVEGIAGNLAWGHQPSEDPQHFADAILATYQDPLQWTSLQQHGQRIAKERFSEATWKARLAERLAVAVEQRDVNRHAAFTGRMLRHHRHRSTEFMSRWIEAKQQLR